MNSDDLLRLRASRLSETPEADSDDRRTPAQRDRDRILYSTAFRRLAEVTQVVRAAEGHHFHNRLTHVLKVAQIGRRIAERLQKQEPADKLLALGGLDPDVVEAAGLAHDLGHPPFGHIAEKKLQEVCTELSAEAFEGNAQSFRIVTKLAIRTKLEGLDLTRATLNAILKYPWLESAKEHKWGVYETEKKEYERAREAAPFKESKTLEAELMDWADDIAYAVYDMDDFFRAGLIPLDRFLSILKTPSQYRGGANALEEFFQNVRERWELQNREKALDQFDQYRKHFEHLLGVGIDADALHTPYTASRMQRAALRHITSYLVGRYANAVTLADPSGNAFQQAKGPSPIKIDPMFKMEVAMLKELTWTYVIESSSLIAQQEGQQLIIETLYRRYAEAADSGNWRIFPSSLRPDLEENMEVLRHNPMARARVVIDLISSMTEGAAFEMYQRLTGHTTGSILQRIVN